MQSVNRVIVVAVISCETQINAELKCLYLDRYVDLSIEHGSMIPLPIRPSFFR